MKNKKIIVSAVVIIVIVVAALFGMSKYQQAKIKSSLVERYLKVKYTDPKNSRYGFTNYVYLDDSGKYYLAPDKPSIREVVEDKEYADYGVHGVWKLDAQNKTLLLQPSDSKKFIDIKFTKLHAGSGMVTANSKREAINYKVVLK